MAAVNKIDSNVVGFRFAEEASPGTLPGTPTWYPLEPNSFSDFGGEINTVARDTINDSRQIEKGSAVGLEATGGLNVDLTQQNIQLLLQGFFKADLREKGTETVTAVDTDTINPDEYEVAETAGFLVGSLIKGYNFTNAANNALNVVTAITTDVSVEVADGQLVAEASPPADARIDVVGFEGDAGDIDVDAAGTWPALTSTTLDFTTLGLIVGEWIYIGGDAASNKFTNAANNGFKRIRSIAANRLEFDISQSAMVTEASTTEQIHLFFGKVLKNEQSSSIVTRTYNLERTLGAPDDAQPSQIQSEYLTGAEPNELTFNFANEDKVTVDLNFIALDNEQRDGATGVKSGNRPSIDVADAFNTSSNVVWSKMYTVDTAGNEAPAALFAFVSEFTININNNISVNKAIGQFGGFSTSAGNFQVSGELTAYFADVAAVQAVRNNDDIAFHSVLVKNNAGIVIDMPLMALGNGRLNVEKDQAIRLPLAMNAARGRKISTNMDHTMEMVFFNYLPSAAAS